MKYATLSDLDDIEEFKKPTEIKNCRTCKEPKSIDDFYPQTQKKLDGKTYRYYSRDCKDCYKRKRKQRELGGTEFEIKTRIARYKVSFEFYQVLIEKQKGACAVCNEQMVTPVLDENGKGEFKLLCENCISSVEIFRKNAMLFLSHIKGF